MDIKRGVGMAMLSEIAAASFNPVIMVYLDWPGGAVRAHSSVGPITWGGYTWSGVGSFGTVDVPAEAMSGLPADFSLSLISEIAGLADYADAQIRQLPGAIFLGVTSSPGGNGLIGDPVMIATGTMDTLVLAVEFEDGSTGYRLTVGMRTGPGYRSAATASHSHEDQSGRYPTDTAGLMLRAAMARAEKTLWPAP